VPPILRRPPNPSAGDRRAGAQGLLDAAQARRVGGPLLLDGAQPSAQLVEVTSIPDAQQLQLSQLIAKLGQLPPLRLSRGRVLPGARLPVGEAGLQTLRSPTEVLDRLLPSARLAEEALEALPLDLQLPGVPLDRRPVALDADGVLNDRALVEVDLLGRAIDPLLLLSHGAIEPGLRGADPHPQSDEEENDDDESAEHRSSPSTVADPGAPAGEPREEHPEHPRRREHRHSNDNLAA
jgi:hypothetical protein